MDNAILLDFGSTHTKVVVVSLKEEKILHTNCFASTVKTDARVGLQQCLDSAKSVLSEDKFEKAIKLASSSAAGGLRMAVIGLSQSLSIKAGRNTAFGAGGKILFTLSGKITPEQVQEFVDAKVEIVLFCGGYENGNETIVLHNAAILAESNLRIPIIYAGNSAIVPSVRGLMRIGRKECFIANNLIPDIRQLNTAMAEDIVREVFLQRIVNMKGLDKVKKTLDDILMPTPSAVLSAGELLTKGTESESGIGELMIIDIGGATTDVHSFAEQTSYKGARLSGAKESYSKRTVESDLGVRESSGLMLNEVGIEKLSETCGKKVEWIKDSIEHRVVVNGYIPDTEDEKHLDEVLAEIAARSSTRRHAGRIEHVHSANCKLLQVGKNITTVKNIIGTGGPIIHNKDPKKVLSSVFKSGKKEENFLLPMTSKLYLDKKYILYSMGLLREVAPNIALRILKKELKEL
ncbi:glutamate mutase L [Fusobacteria bacterium ZRK30]|nr:glutamate mutase L [Fusobacteria bacterium ZRK30]